MSSSEQQQMQRQHIFVVNDSPDFLDVIREFLHEERYNVTTTTFVPRTYDQIAALDPALVIVDLVAGQNAGWELLELLCREVATQGIPVIVVSTSPAILDEAQADPARFGGQYFLRKPFDLDDLLAKVTEAIGPA